MTARTKLYIDNVSKDTEGKVLEKELEKYGELVQFELFSDNAYVSYATEQQAQKAIDAMNGKKFEGNELQVDFKDDSSEGEEQSKSLSRSRSRERRRSRSRSRDRRRSSPYGRSNGFRGSKYGTKCFNCGKDGHFARYCPDKDWTFLFFIICLKSNNLWFVF